MAATGIYDYYAISKGVVTGSQLIHKYGRNTDVDAAEDIWGGGGDYTGFPTGAAETVDVFSSSALDTAAGTGARTVLITGCGATFNAQQETLTLNGVTPVTSVNQWMRVSRIEALTAGTLLTNQGTISVRHTTTVANIFATMPVGVGISEVAGITVPLGMTGAITAFGASCLDTGTTRVQIALKTRNFGGATITSRPFVASAGEFIHIPVSGGLLYPEKTDIMMRCISTSSANAIVAATFDIILAVII